MGEHFQTGEGSREREGERLEGRVGEKVSMVLEKDKRIKNNTCT